MKKPKLHRTASGTIIAISVILLIAVIILFLTKSQQPSSPQTPSGSTIEITSAGFSPRILTINAGETITFTNRNIRPSWPASNTHPIHTLYPGSGSEKCGTSDQSNIFDACKGLAQEEAYSFTFNEVGKWRYHDHLNPSLTGIITVQ